MVHAENHDCVRWLTERLLVSGNTGMKFHGTAHSPISDREATHRAIALSEIAAFRFSLHMFRQAKWQNKSAGPKIAACNFC